MTEGAIPPKLKAKLKDHKDGKPLREVSDATKAPGHNLAKALNQIFTPYTGQTKTAANEGKELIKFIREGRFDGNFLGSCDAIALYPSVLVEGLELLQEEIEQDQSLQNKTDLAKEEIYVMNDE